MYKQVKKTLLSTGRERNPGTCLLFVLVKRRRICSIGGSGNMQLKYVFYHYFFTFLMKLRAWQIW